MRSNLAACIAALATFAVAGAFAQTTTSRQREALDLIDQFAERLCTTVGTSAKATDWNVSGEARAEVKGVVKKIADLGFRSAGEVSQKQTEGVLQSDLAKVLESKTDCKFKVFMILQAKLITTVNNTRPSEIRESQRSMVFNSDSAPKSAEQTAIRNAPSVSNRTFWTGKPTKRFQVFAVSNPTDHCYAIDKQAKFYSFIDKALPCDPGYDPQSTELTPIIELVKELGDSRRPFRAHMLKDGEEEESYPGVFSYECVIVMLQADVPAALVVGVKKTESDREISAARPLALFVPTERGTVDAFALAKNRRAAVRRFEYTLVSSDQFNSVFSAFSSKKGYARSPSFVIPPD